MTDTKQRTQTHHPDCGDVGKTGKHGDLGGNASDAPRAVAPPVPEAAPAPLTAGEQSVVERTLADLGLEK